ncbi:hypothetical protein [Sphingomonas leidyi]|uniref:hypothetical protein n=1 Tax=Sphingomonas leidyi TaxID=68569 RepID=UPI0036D3CADA
MNADPASDLYEIENDPGVREWLGAPMVRERHRIAVRNRFITIVATAAGLILVATLALQTQWQQRQQSAAQALAEQQEEADTRYQPLLAQRMAALTPAEILTAFDRFANSNDCQKGQIAHILNGNSGTDNCRGEYAPENGMEGWIGQDRIRFVDVRTVPLAEGATGRITTRVTVQPMTSFTVEGRPLREVSGEDSPIAALVRTRGLEAVRGWAARGRCAALFADSAGAADVPTQPPAATRKLNVYAASHEIVFAGCLDAQGFMHPV